MNKTTFLEHIENIKHNTKKIDDIVTFYLLSIILDVYMFVKCK